MKKQINLLILSLVVALSSACAPKPAEAEAEAEAPGGGESCPRGASSEPLSTKLLVDTDSNNLLEINNEKELRRIRYDMKGTGCTGTDGACLGYELKSDITLTKDWTPVGGRHNVLDASIKTATDCMAEEDGKWDEESLECLVSTVFRGIFDGGDNTIRNLRIRATGLHNVGFFGRVRGEEAVIKNLHFVGGSVESSYSYSDIDGDGVIKDEKVNGFAPEITTYIGAVVGSLEEGGGDGASSMEGVSSNVSVKVSRCEPIAYDSRIGGLVGGVSLPTGGTRPVTVRSSSSTGNVSGGSGNDYVGGLIGEHGVSAFLDGASSATGNVDGGDGNDRVGGLIGSVSGNAGENQALVSSSYATGNVNGGEGDDQVGGLIGAMNRAHLYSGYVHTGTVNGGSGDDQVGGLVGELRNGNLENSYASSHANGDAGDDQVGGLIGANGSTSLVSSSYATGTVNGDEGDDSVGGLVGQNYTVSERDSNPPTLIYSTGKIVRSYATGNVDGGDGTADQVVGPLVGDNTTPDATPVAGTVTSSYYNSDSAVEGGEGTADPSGTGKSLLALAAQTQADPMGTDTGTDQTSCETALGGTWDTSASPNVCTNDHFEGWNGATFEDWDFGDTTQFPTLKSYKFDYTYFCTGGTVTTQEACEADSSRRWSRGNIDAIMRVEGDILCGQPGQADSPATRVACSTN